MNQTSPIHTVNDIVRIAEAKAGLLIEMVN